MIRPIVTYLLLGCTGAKGNATDDTSMDTEATDDTSRVQDTSSLDETGDTQDTVEILTGCRVDRDMLDRVDSTVGEFVVGNFHVVLDGNAALGGYHNANANHMVFESVSSNWLHMGTVNMHITENQGSFGVEYTLEDQCANMHIDSLYAGLDAFEIHGGFRDASDLCAAVEWRLFACATDDNRLQLTIDSLSNEINYASIDVLSTAQERIFGMGEQFAHDTLNLKGRSIPVIVQEGGVGRGHIPITPVVNQFSPGSGGSEDSTYYVAPHYLTDQLHSLFLENTGYAEFDFTGDTRTQIRVFEPQITLQAIYGTSPLELISEFTEYAGRMPEPPDWVNEGAIVALARNLQESENIIGELQNSGVHIAGVWNQTWSGINNTFIGEQVLWNWEQSESSHPNWQSWVQNLQAENIQTLCYINPMFYDVTGHASNPDRNLFAEGIAGGYFIRDATGAPLLFPVTAFDVAMLDLTNPEARTWMKSIIQKEMIENAGCRGWMVDFAEALPTEAHLFDGSSAELYHNIYPVEWMRLNREAIEEAGMLGEILTFNRSGFSTSPTYSLLFWEGDQLTTWDKYDGLKSAIHGLVNGGFSGLALNHSDTGGYTSLSRWGLGYSREEQLLKRWGEMSAFTSVLRTHEGNQPGENAQIYSNADMMEHFARVSALYKGLAPYRKQLFTEASAQGWPVVRHLWLEYPQDPQVFSYENQFLMGSDILVAPTVEKCLFGLCNHQQSAYLPSGNWVHIWTGDLYTGGQEVSVYAPFGYPAVFYKQGSSVMATVLENWRTLGLDVHP